MFRITEDPSSESLVQCLAKIMAAYCDPHMCESQYAAITPTTSMSTDTIKPLL